MAPSHIGEWTCRIIPSISFHLRNLWLGELSEARRSNILYSLTIGPYDVDSTVRGEDDAYNQGHA